MTRVGVVSFPGTCDGRDAAHALRLIGAEPVSLWHEDTDVGGCDAVVVPGGFTFGDHLRPGAIAAHSPVMAAVRAHAEAGGPVLGICNGFQVLTELGLLPGVLRPNAGLRFRCQDAELVVVQPNPWLPGCASGTRLTVPIKHHDGCWFADSATLAEVERHGQILVRYLDNPNGSVADVAGVTNRAGNVAALMPHPEHAVEQLIGSTDGRILLQGLLDLARRPVAA